MQLGKFFPNSFSACYKSGYTKINAAPANIVHDNFVFLIERQFIAYLSFPNTEVDFPLNHFLKRDIQDSQLCSFQ